jgi:hypothetical protein
VGYECGTLMGYMSNKNKISDLIRAGAIVKYARENLLLDNILPLLLARAAFCYGLRCRSEMYIFQWVLYTNCSKKTVI